MRDDEGVTIAGGQAQLKGKIIRIAHMGCLMEEDILTGLTVLEKVLNNRDVGQSRNSIFTMVFGDLVNAADDGGATITDDHPGFGVFGRDGSVGGTHDREGQKGLSLLDADVQENSTFRGHVRCDVET